MAPEKAQAQPEGWKSYDEFAACIATNRLPMSDALVGKTLTVALPQSMLILTFEARHTVHWTASGEQPV